MPNKDNRPSTTHVIRWTDEEWAQIAQQLYSEKEASVRAGHLEDIKAKDVFVAQDVLPADRQRKLVSIAQGFEGIREKLRSLFSTISAAHQNDLFQAPGAQGAAGNQEQAARRKAQPQAARASDAAPVTQAVEAPAVPAEAPNVSLADDATSANDTVTANDTDEPTAQQQSVEAPAAVDTPASRREMQEVREAPERHRQQSVPTSDPAAAERRQEQAISAMPVTPPQQTVTEFVEMARPFVAMVWQEFAKAMVSTISEHAADPAFRGAVQQMLGSQPQPMQAGRRRPDHPAQQAPAKQRPAPVMAPDAEMQPLAESSDGFEEEAVHPSDAQPLFDPKLPPSANSEFKPTIGLVGANSDQFEDLRQRYPQLQLLVVPVEAVRNGNVFRQCQRIIGLSDEMPPATDEFLKQSLRNRYVRLAGGIVRVKEQLSYWLDKPGSISAGPKGPMQRNRYGKKPNKGGGGGGGGGFDKRNNNRRPGPGS